MVIRGRTKVLPLLVSLTICSSAAPENARFIRSLSGPSGKVVGSKFVFDDTRNRFVYPQDKFLTIYFEWEAQPGAHTLTGIWKQPDGRTGSISPDVKIETQTNFLSCYWIFTIAPGLQNGVWTLDTRVDGQPAGSHPFEIAGIEDPRATPLPETAIKQPTLDEIYKAASPSIVSIYKLDTTARRTDTTTGFVFQPNRIATAFQSIDSATRLEVEFASGRKVAVPEIIAWSRAGDWAILSADTGSIPALPRGDPKAISVGERLIVFNVEGTARVIGGVDIGGRRRLPTFGERIQISPAVAAEAAGGPLLNAYGQVVAILGGSLNPGARFSGRVMSLSPALWNSFSAENAATPLSEIPESLPSSGKTLEVLTGDGTLTAPITTMAEFIYGGTSVDLPKHASDPMPHEIGDFSVRDPQIAIHSLWARKGKLSKGSLSVSVYDALNQLRLTASPKKVTLEQIPLRFAFTFSPAALKPGIYRVDLNWDGHAAWRTFIRITE